MAEHSALDVAKYFLAKTADEETGDAISNLKLQKLLYYAQGVHLALRDKPLFDERIEAWTNGPVIPEVYTAYKQHGSSAIPPEQIDASAYSSEVQEVLDEVYEVFGQYSGWKLKNMTSDEPPWKNTTRSEIIKLDDLKEYFLTIVNEEDDDG
jgi:uncharacterized phage-associated protein